MTTLCVTLREVTEWIEIVNACVNFLAGHKFGRIIRTVHDLERDYDDVILFTRNLFGALVLETNVSHNGKKSRST